VNIFACGFSGHSGCIYFKISLVGQRILLNPIAEAGDEANHTLMNDSMCEQEKWVWL